MDKFKLDMDLLNKCTNKPEIFEESKSQEAFWDNEYISKMMLEAHLNPDWDAASRKKETIEASCSWIMSSLNLKKDDKVMDLGCGPGLYSTILSKNGLNVTGVDYSKRSIEYAKKQALINNQPIQYVYMNYLDIEYSNEYDVAMMIYCDFGVLSEENSKMLLKKVHSSLKEKGYFIFDVWTVSNTELTSNYRNWSLNMVGGFWRPTPYVELIDKVYYDKENVSLAQHTIIEDDGNISVYNLWERCYTKESISELLSEMGFEVIGVYSDLTGTVYKEGSNSLGVIARKK